MWIARLLMLALCLAGWSKMAAAAQRTPIPETYSLVNDLIGHLSIEQQYNLGRKLSELENHNGTQIILLIVPTTGEEGIEAYSLRVVEAWQPGHNGESTAVLFAIDASNASFYIRTGPAVAGALPDALVRRIWMKHLDPHWRRGEWFEGIDATIDAMIAVLRKEETAPPQWITFYSLTPRGWAGMSLILLALVYTVFHLTKWLRTRRQGARA